MGDKATAGIFVTFPKPGLSNFSGAIDQVKCKKRKDSIKVDSLLC